MSAVRIEEVEIGCSNPDGSGFTSDDHDDCDDDGDGDSGGDGGGEDGEAGSTTAPYTLADVWQCVQRSVQTCLSEYLVDRCYH